MSSPLHAALADLRARRSTDAGRSALNGSFEPLPTGSELIDYWHSRLPEGEWRTLDVLIVAEGEDVPRDRIDEVTGYGARE